MGSHESYLNDRWNPFPILECTTNLYLEYPEGVNEQMTLVSDHVTNRMIIHHEFHNPLLGFSNFLNNLLPFVL